MEFVERSANIFSAELSVVTGARVEGRALVGLRVAFFTTVLLCVCLRFTLVPGRFCSADMAWLVKESSSVFPLSFWPGTSVSRGWVTGS